MKKYLFVYFVVKSLPKIKNLARRATNSEIRFTLHEILILAAIK
jgi:hypothetical protein